MPGNESRHAIRFECLSDQPVVQTGQPRLHIVREHSETAIAYNLQFQTVVSVVTANLSANNSGLQQMRAALFPSPGVLNSQPGVVEPIGIEPTTSSLQSSRSPN